MATAQILPKELRLQAPATMPQARSYLFKQQSTQSQYTEGQTIQINIPRLQRSYLTKDSYLKLTTSIALTPTLKQYVYTNLATSLQAHEDIVCLDTPGIAGMINKIEVFDYLGSTLLESTNGHGQLLATLLDLGLDFDTFATHMNITMGTSTSTISLDAAVGTIVSTPNTNFPQGFDHSLAGAQTTVNDVTGDNGAWGTAGKNGWSPATRWRISEPLNGEVISKFNLKTSDLTPQQAGGVWTITKEYAIPLFSFLGVLSPKFAPLHNGYTINIQLNPWTTALSHTYAIQKDDASTTDPARNNLLQTTVAQWGPPASSSFSKTASYIKDVYLACQVLELGPVAESMLLSSTQGQPLVVPTKAYRQYVGSIAAQTPQYRLDLNLNVASLTNILFIMRDAGSLAAPELRRVLSHRVRNHLQSWYFQYGSSILPQTSGISAKGRAGAGDVPNKEAFTECYCELVKSRHGFNNTAFNTVLSRYSYQIDESPTTGITNILSPLNNNIRGTFAAGLDLELVSGRSNDLICGMNTNGMNTSIFLNFDGTNAKAVQLDCWCEYDAFINISPGLASTVSF